MRATTSNPEREENWQRKSLGALRARWPLSPGQGAGLVAQRCWRSPARRPTWWLPMLRIIAINLRGVFLCMKFASPLMLEQEGGAFVNSFLEPG